MKSWTPWGSKPRSRPRISCQAQQNAVRADADGQERSDRHRQTACADQAAKRIPNVVHEGLSSSFGFPGGGDAVYDLRHRSGSAGIIPADVKGKGLRSSSDAVLKSGAS